MNTTRVSTLTHIRRKYTYSNKTKEQWLTILKLATKWQFKEVRSLSIRELEKLDIDPVEKIAIYKEFKIKPELLLPSYISICKKDRLPSPEEGKILSIETVLKIASAREEMILSALSSGRRSPADAPDDITRAIIARLFELGLTPHPNDQPVNGVERPNPTGNNINGSGDTPAGTEATAGGRGRGLNTMVSQGNFCATTVADEYVRMGLGLATVRFMRVPSPCSSNSFDVNIVPTRGGRGRGS